ncbi:MAG: recombinase family protein, partial [Planctomycetota bacterium]
MVQEMELQKITSVFYGFQFRKKFNPDPNGNFYAMLQKPIYAGEIEVFDEETGEFLQTIQGNHQGIVSKELFQKVQDIFNQSKRKGIKARQAKENFPLQGYLICHKCNEVLDISSNNASRNKNFRHSYYCCKDCKGKGTWHNINKIHESFLTFLRALKPNPQLLEGFYLVMEYVFKSSTGNQKLELSRIEEKLKTMEQKRLDATTKFVGGDLERDDFNLFKESLKEEKLTLDHRKSELKEMDQNYLEYLKFGHELLANLDQYYLSAPFEVKRKFVGSLFPQKLTFEAETLRTTSVSQLFQFFSRNN